MLFLLLQVVAHFTLFACQLTAHRPSVTIKNGTVVGLDLPQFSQSLFLGIPYSQPPVDGLRLKPPRSMNSSFGELDATVYGPHCWPAFAPGSFSFKDDDSGFNNSEDCLTLNIIRPYGVSVHSPVPVVVWIHGGGFFTGGSASIANEQPIVFVSINYRLASLGFSGGEALHDEGSLNLGLRDQRLALHWVQENIAEFGGNPRKITIQGQSVRIIIHLTIHVGQSFIRQAGGSSVHAQIIAYGGRNDKLFNQAIIQSGTFNLNFSQPDAPTPQAAYDSLLENTSCASTANSPAVSQLNCLRSIPIDEFRQASVSTAMSPGIFFDGDFIDTPGLFQAYRSGKWVKVPHLLGSNTDEGWSITPTGANSTIDAKASLVGHVPAENTDAILDLYFDVPTLGCPFDTGDFQPNPLQQGPFRAPGVPGLQNKRVAAIVGDVFVAAFNHKPYDVSSGIQDFIGHMAEIAYVFNTQNNDTDFWKTHRAMATFLGPTAPIADRFLGVYMSRAWASFAATGNPNNANVPTKIHWPKYSESRQNMVWQTQGCATEQDDYREAGMRFIMDNIFFPSG
ncbi:Alpha/Beta hydrolase protein [Mycena crocata]|nr:Alpha/Beta hydrolase protein [Mycena crocata]